MSPGRLPPIRVWEDGPAPAARHRELDHHQWQGARSGTASLRFWRSRPTASLGRYQAARHALRTDFCRARGIPTVRRLTGGGALYLDEHTLGWTLALPDNAPGASLGSWLERLGVAVAAALRDLGLPAEYATPDAVEIDGRKLGALALRTGDGAVVIQGTVLLDVDVASMLRVLRVPKEKLTPEGLDGARQRLATVAEHRPKAALAATVAGALGERLGQALGAPLEPGRPEPLPAGAPPENVGVDPEPVHEAFGTTGGGILYAGVTPNAEGDRLGRTAFAGALHLTPPDLLDRLAEHLAGCPLEQAPERARAFLAAGPGEILGAVPEEVAGILARAIDRRHQEAALGLSTDEANSLMVHDPEGAASAEAILERADHVLVPYCAKPVWCKWRHRDGCPDCGLCAVGEVYRLARERGLAVTTVRNFEHLTATLDGMRQAATPAYLGMCCSNFYLKREYAFRAAGIPAVLLDISGANCYELGQEELAYRGEFAAQAELNGPATRKALRRIPARGEGSAEE